ncbi:MAG TPA: hypothetical protein ENI23_09220 [bacterium]|nr:hypothetical protein [bacterium]
MYPVIEEVETKGLFKQNLRSLSGSMYEADPCVLVEENPFYVECAKCGRYMSKSEIDYETYRKASFEWLETKLQEVKDDYEYKLKNIVSENDQIRVDNIHRSEDKQKPEWTPETLLERFENQTDEVDSHGRQNWLKNTLSELIKQGRGHGIKCYDCRI